MQRANDEYVDVVIRIIILEFRQKDINILLWNVLSHRWGGYRLWNRHTVRVPLVGRLAETMRWGNMLVTHMLMGFGKDHKTLDKDSSFQLKVPSNEKKNL